MTSQACWRSAGAVIICVPLSSSAVIISPPLPSPPARRPGFIGFLPII